jgi:outer membrane protein assembly factor BamA
MVMQFSISGSNLTVGSVEFSDPVAQKSDKLRERTADLMGKRFSRYAIELFENQQVRPLYAAAGQLRVRFGEPVVRLAGDAKSAQAVPVQLAIDPGPVFHVGTITWNGDTLLHEAGLAPLLGVKMGDLADGNKLDAGWQRIEKEYAHRGYIDVHVDPQAQFADETATVSYRVMINQGPQYRMGDLVVTGLSLTAERIVRAVWTRAGGDVFDEAFYDEMLAKLAKPSSLIFGELPLHYTELGHWLRRNPEAHTVDVLLDFK